MSNAREPEPPQINSTTRRTFLQHHLIHSPPPPLPAASALLWQRAPAIHLCGAGQSDVSLAIHIPAALARHKGAGRAAVGLEAGPGNILDVHHLRMEEAEPVLRARWTNKT